MPKPGNSSITVTEEVLEIAKNKSRREKRSVKNWTEKVIQEA